MTKLSQDKIDAMQDQFSFVPEHMRAGIINYIENGLPAGGFLSAVLENDLKSACGRADHINQQHIPSIVAWFWNFAPSTCWGSREKVEAWYKVKNAERAA